MLEMESYGNVVYKTKLNYKFYTKNLSGIHC
jgi:subtilase family serine protease